MPSLGTRVSEQIPPVGGAVEQELEDRLRAGPVGSGRWIHVRLGECPGKPGHRWKKNSNFEVQRISEPGQCGFVLVYLISFSYWLGSLGCRWEGKGGFPFEFQYAKS